MLRSFGNEIEKRFRSFGNEIDKKNCVSAHHASAERHFLAGLRLRWAGSVGTVATKIRTLFGRVVRCCYATGSRNRILEPTHRVLVSL